MRVHKSGFCFSSFLNIDVLIKRKQQRIINKYEQKAAVAKTIAFTKLLRTHGTQTKLTTSQPGLQRNRALSAQNCRGRFW